MVDLVSPLVCQFMFGERMTALHGDFEARRTDVFPSVFLFVLGLAAVFFFLFLVFVEVIVFPLLRWFTEFFPLLVSPLLSTLPLAF